MFPLADHLLVEQLDSAELRGSDERKRLNILRTFLPNATWAARTTDALLQAIAQAEEAVQSADALTSDIRGALEKLRKP